MEKGLDSSFESDFSSPAIMRKTVVLPLPEGPTIAVIVPSSADKLKSTVTVLIFLYKLFALKNIFIPFLSAQRKNYCAQNGKNQSCCTGFVKAVASCKTVSVQG